MDSYSEEWSQIAKFQKCFIAKSQISSFDTDAYLIPNQKAEDNLIADAG